jgi:hypothetical protein
MNEKPVSSATTLEVENAPAEEAKRDHRIGAALFPGEEEGEEHRAGDEQADRARRGPGVRADADHGDDERGERAGHERGADEVELAPLACRGIPRPPRGKRRRRSRRSGR